MEGAVWCIPPYVYNCLYMYIYFFIIFIIFILFIYIDMCIYIILSDVLLQVMILVPVGDLVRAPTRSWR